MDTTQEINEIEQAGQDSLEASEIQKPENLLASFLGYCNEEERKIIDEFSQTLGIRTNDAIWAFVKIFFSFNRANNNLPKRITDALDTKKDEIIDCIENATEIPQDFFREHIYKFIEYRKNIYIQNILTYMAKQPNDLTFADTLFKYLSIIEKLLDFNLTNSFDKNNIFIDGSQLYAEMKQRPKGMKTGIKAIDEKIGGMTAGTVTTLAGFTSHFKTTFALNIAYLNSYYSGYNIIYITLETPKQDMYWNLLSIHSYDTKFRKYNYIEHERIRRGELNPDEEKYLFDVIEPDLKNEGVGQIIFLDEADFNTFSFSEIKRILQSIDENVPKGIHAVVVDYIQLCKFRDTNRQYDTNSQINYYVSFFRQLAQHFRTITDSNGSKYTKELVVILLAQLNREGWKKAKRNEGRYDITALADANELERGSFRVFTIYTDENMKARGSAQVQILKNRSGQTMYEPANISVIPEAYVVTDEDIGFKNYPCADGQASTETAFNSLIISLIISSLLITIVK